MSASKSFPTAPAGRAGWTGWGGLVPPPLHRCADLVFDLGLATALTTGYAMLRLATPNRKHRAPDHVARPTGDTTWQPPSTTRGRTRKVTTDDGVTLHVEVDGSRRAELTVVLCHGYALDLRSWGFQREHLRRRARVVAYDQRGHGRSGRGRPEHSDIARLGKDLLAVLDATAPTGPVVLVGHSMGGMAILALAAQRPDLFGDRVVGVGLLACSAGPVHARLGLPRYVADTLHQAVPTVLSALRSHRPLSRWAAGDLALLLTRRFAFASEVPAALVSFLADMIQQTSIETLADFFPHFRTHENTAALPPLRRVQTLVAVGDRDLLTPLADSQAIVDEVPDAEFVVAGGSGHAVILERADLLTGRLLALLDRVRPGKHDRAACG
jgi:pimeloyl-ACP methyl ester carboxylesterase